MPRPTSPRATDRSRGTRPRAARGVVPVPVPVLGLTGAAGAGKSTVAAILADLGCAVIDVDGLGHAALDAPEVAAEVRRVFGDAAAGSDDRVDRRALAGIAFTDPARLRHLEAIVHPWVMRRLRIDIARHTQSQRRTAAPRAVVVDCALLFESGLDLLCDATAVVTAPRPVRARRVRLSRGWSSEELRRREAAQLPAAEKRAHAGHVLPNGEDAAGDGGRGTATLRRAVARLLRVLTSKRVTSKEGGPGTPGARAKAKSKDAGSKPAKRKRR